MIKQWAPVIDDINQEILRLNASLADVPFNSDFSHRMQILKIRTFDLEKRLYALCENIKSEAAAERAQIDLMMAEFRHEVQKASSALAELRIFRAERSRANYLHIMDLKKVQEEKGGDK